MINRLSYTFFCTVIPLISGIFFPQMPSSIRSKMTIAVGIKSVGNIRCMSALSASFVAASFPTTRDVAITQIKNCFC